jgi:hypothetical protein
MLGKLLKYEVKATARIFLPIYGVLLIFSVLTRIFIDINSNALVLKLVSVISTIAYVFIIIATFALTLVVMIQRFYKNLLNDEGYLMFTLPVKPRLLIESKLLVSMLWMILSTIFTMISVFILAVRDGFWDSLGRVINQFFVESQQTFGVNGTVFIIEFIVMMLISIIMSILMIYASVSIGQTFNKHKLLASFGAYLALNMATQMIISILFLIASAFNPSVWTNMVTNESLPHLFLIGISVLQLAFSAAFYIITKHILTKRLNLE